jgi:hypothetical protein
LFRPRHHFVLIDEVFQQNGVDIIVFPVHKSNSVNSSPQDESIFDRLLRPTLVPITSAVDIEGHPDNAIHLRTTAVIPVQEPISQNVYNLCMLVVGSVRGNGFDAIRLDATSSTVFTQLTGITHETFNEEYSQALALNGGIENPGKLSCGCGGSAHLHLLGKDNKSFSAPSDIVVEVAYDASSDEVSRWAGGLRLHEDREKTLLIVELFARWLPWRTVSNLAPRRELVRSNDPRAHAIPDCEQREPSP